VLRRASTSIAQVLGEMAAAHIDHELKGKRALARRPAVAGRRLRGRRRAEITRWVADRNARRVPLFVIEMTNGLDTKKKIVAKFGENAAFEKGKPLPKAK